MKIQKILASLLGIAFSLGCPVTEVNAQKDSTGAVIHNSPLGGSEKFLLAGEAFTTWQTTKIQGLPATNSFGNDPNYPMGLMLMPLVKLTDRLFLDAQVQVSANPGPGGGTNVGLNEAIIYYRLTPEINLFAGDFQPRTGLYEGVLDDFTNRYGSVPIGMGISALTEPGVGVQGGIQLGYSKLLYQLFVANGPQLVVDSTGAQNGQLNYANYSDNNNNKAVGGEIGLLPFSNSTLELGISGQYTPHTGNAGSPLENISNTTYAAYVNYYHLFSPLMIRAQGQYEYSQTQGYNLYTNASDTSLLVPKFTNQMSGWFGGVTFRLSGSSNTFISNLELAGRFGQLTLPQGAAWGAAHPENQTTICLTYWLTWKTPLNLAYDIYTQSGAPTQTVFTVRGMWFF